MIEPGDVRTLRILREKEKWADLPVIVIAAHAHDEFGSESSASTLLPPAIVPVIPWKNR